MMLNDADDSLWEGIIKKICNHVLHPYLPERQDSFYNPRQLFHNRTLITKTNYMYVSERDFFIRILHKNC